MIHALLASLLLLAAPAEVPAVSSPAVTASATTTPVTPILNIDFGLFAPMSPAAQIFPAGSRDSLFGWTGGPIRDFTNSHAKDTKRRDGVLAGPIDFQVGIDSPGGACHVDLTFGLPQMRLGTVDIFVDSTRVATWPDSAAGPDVAAASFDATPRDGRLRIRFRPRACDSFPLATLVLTAPPGATLHEIFPDGDSSRPPVPPAATLRKLDRAALEAQLARDVAHLQNERLLDGTYSVHHTWYENSFTVRAFLAASQIEGRPELKKSAFAILDRFVAAEQTNGGWFSNYVPRPECPGSGDASAMSANMADIGAVTIALAQAIPFAEGERRTTYLAALTRYLDDVSLPNQRDDGSFPNRLWSGTDGQDPYSIATATQASTLMLAATLTGETKYREAAERAASWLAVRVQDDGKVSFAPYDRPLETTYEAIRIGDLYYIMEAMMTVAQLTKSPALVKSLDGAFDRWTDGKNGFYAAAVEGYWWQMGDLWADSKLAGVPHLLALRALRLHSPPATQARLAHALAWLDDDGLARRIGVRASIASSTGEYMFGATGFAALSVATTLDPQLLVPKPPAKGGAQAVSSGPH